MKIGELSRRTGVSVRMLRYYEGEGLLAPQRTGSGYRDYGPAEEETVRRIKMLGVSRDDARNDPAIAAVCTEQRSGLHAVQRVAKNIAKQVGLIDQRIETLSQSRTILAGYLASVN